MEELDLVEVMVFDWVDLGMKDSDLVVVFGYQVLLVGFEGIVNEMVY